MTLKEEIQQLQNDLAYYDSNGEEAKLIRENILTLKLKYNDNK